MTSLDDRLIARFWIKVDKTGDCWEWMAARNPYRGDYGIFWMKLPKDSGRRGITLLAHRVAWEITNGRPVPAGMLVCHTCDNPPCVRPDHLFLDTDAGNTADKIRKGRSSPMFRLPEPEARTVRWPDARLAPEPKAPRQTRKRTRKPRPPREPRPNRSIKLSDDAVRAIRARRASGEGCSALASEYGVHRHTITNIVGGRFRKSVT